MKANTVWIAENLIAMASDQKDGVGSYNRIISKEEKHEPSLHDTQIYWLSWKAESTYTF